MANSQAGKIDKTSRQKEKKNGIGDESRYTEETNDKAEVQNERKVKTHMVEHRLKTWVTLTYNSQLGISLNYMPRFHN